MALVLAFDPATTTGFAIGEAGGDAVPESGSVRLRTRHEDIGTALYNLWFFFHHHIIIQYGKPDWCVIEAPMAYGGQKSIEAARLSIALPSIIQLVCKRHSISFREAAASTVRKHFIGSARTGDRAQTKAAVINRCRALGYIPPFSKDDNRADACAVWDFGAHVYARARPSHLILHGEQASLARPIPEPPADLDALS